MNESNGSITPNQLSCMIIGALMGVQTLFVSSYYIEHGGQDAWICTILGGIYPVSMVLIAAFICKRFPEDNILKLSKRFLGKFLGSIFNLVFLIQLFIYSAVRCTELSDVIRVFIDYFLTQKVTILIIVIAAAYSVYNGITALARANEFIFYFTIIMVLVPVGVFTRGDLHNLLPVFNVSLTGIAQSTVRAGYDYFGIEIIFLLYPFMKNKTEFLKVGLKAVGISVGVVTWFTFASIYYFGIDIMPKYLWVAVETSKAFRMMTIKNFTFIFLFFWVMIGLKNISNNYFSSALILNEFWSKLDIKKYTLILAPLIFYAALKFGNETMSREIMAYMVPLFTLFDIIYVSIIALLIKFRTGKTNFED